MASDFAKFELLQYTLREYILVFSDATSNGIAYMLP